MNLNTSWNTLKNRRKRTRHYSLLLLFIINPLNSKCFPSSSLSICKNCSIISLNYIFYYWKCSLLKYNLLFWLLIKNVIKSIRSLLLILFSNFYDSMFLINLYSSFSAIYNLLFSKRSASNCNFYSFRINYNRFFWHLNIYLN